MQITWTHPNGKRLDFNDPDRGVTIAMYGITGLGEPPRHELRLSQSMRDGDRKAAYRFGARTIYIPVRLRQTPTESIAEVLARVTELLTVPSFAYTAYYPGFSFSNDADPEGGLGVTTDSSYRGIACRVEKFEFIGNETDAFRLDYTELGVTFRAEYPWWSDNSSSQIVDVDFGPAVSGGPFYAPDADRVFNVGSSNSTGGTPLPNVGDLPVWLTFAVYGPLTSLRVWQDDHLSVELVKDLSFVEPGDNALYGVTDPASAVLYGPSNPSGYGLLCDLSDFTIWAWQPVIPDRGGPPQVLTVDVRGGGRFHASYVPLYRRGL